MFKSLRTLNSTEKMERLIGNNGIVVYICQFAVENIVDCIRLSNICSRFREGVEISGAWEELFHSRWPLQTFHPSDEPRERVIREYKIDLMVNKMPREFNTPKFSTRVERQLEKKSHKGIHRSYRYPLNWFRGFSHLFNFYGGCRTKESACYDLGPYFITKKEVIGRSVIRRKDLSFRITGQKKLHLSVMKFDGEVELMIVRKLYLFAVDEIIKNNPCTNFFRTIVSFFLDFSRVKYDQIKIFELPPSFTYLQSQPPLDQNWIEIEPLAFSAAILDPIITIDFHLVLSKDCPKNDFQHHLFKCKFLLNDTEASLELILTKKKVGANLESQKLKRSITMREYEGRVNDRLRKEEEARRKKDEEERYQIIEKSASCGDFRGVRSVELINRKRSYTNRMRSLLVDSRALKSRNMRYGKSFSAPELGIRGRTKRISSRSIENVVSLKVLGKNKRIQRGMRGKRRTRKKMGKKKKRPCSKKRKSGGRPLRK